jgi:beta-lactamase superfamily II metal-dependent hydrolase
MTKKNSNHISSQVPTLHNRRRRKALIISGVVFLVVAGLLGAYVWHWEVRPHVLEVHTFLADTIIATFIRTPDNHTILIDGGKTNAIMRSLTSLMPFYRRTIDTVILTKNDDAHAAGLVDVLTRYHVGQVVEMAATVPATIASTSTAYLEFEKIIAEKKISDKRVALGGELSFEQGMHGAVSSAILFPPAVTSSEQPTFKFSKTNLPQLALCISYGATSFVSGDLSKTEQKFVAISLASSSMSTNVLISQHAGGSNAVDEYFFDSLNPDYVVISKKPTVPHLSAAAKKPKKPPFSIFDATNTKIINLVTDGNVEFISDGNSVIKK